MSNTNWRKHDNYEEGASVNRIVTRSQTGFNRVEKTSSNLDLFSDSSKHSIPQRPHLMSVMKGEYGGIPRTTITRSTGGYLEITKELNDALKPYKQFKSNNKSQGSRARRGRASRNQ